MEKFILIYCEKLLRIFLIQFLLYQVSFRLFLTHFHGGTLNIYIIFVKDTQ